MTIAAMTTNPIPDPPGGRYDHFLGQQRDAFATLAGTGPLFTTDAADLWPAFLAALPEHERQHHTCHACRHFVERYGNLVAIDTNGRTTPVMWGEAEGIYEVPFAALRRLVASAKVNGVFLSSDRTWGTPKTGEWRHMAVTPPAALIYKAGLLKTAGQAMAERREEYGMLCRGLAEFSAETVAQAVTLLDADVLYRDEKVRGPATWLAELHAKRTAVKGKVARENVTWLAVASAPPGFAHVRSTMIGTLLEDIAAGLPFADVAAKFRAKMRPLLHQRPQAPPSAGNIAQAERLVESLGIAPSLRRRFARLDEVTALWRPTPEAPKDAGGSVFGHLTPKGAKPATPMALPPATLTWVKFRDTVLPEATAIECLVPGHGAFVALLTAADPDAPPILQWDREDERNPVSLYVYTGGSPASQWRLAASSWTKVTAVTLRPSQWDPDRDYSHHGEGVLFLLDGAVDTRTGAGNALFPGTLRSELHGVRATVEAYSRSAEIEGRDEASACGLVATKDGAWGHSLRVTSKADVRVYKIDRWD